MIIQCKVRWLGLTKILGKRNSVQCAQKQYDIKGLFIGCLTAIWYFVTICRRNCVTTRNSWKKFQLSAWERRSVVTFCASRGKQENQLNTGLIIAAWEELKCSPAVNEHAEIFKCISLEEKKMGRNTKSWCILAFTLSCKNLRLIFWRARPWHQEPLFLPSVLTIPVLCLSAATQSKVGDLHFRDICTFYCADAIIRVERGVNNRWYPLLSPLAGGGHVSPNRV